MIPKRCDLVHRALSGGLGQTAYTASTGKYRYIDLIALTGRNSTERKLRELIEECPGLVAHEEVTGADGTRFKRFWIATVKTQGTLFTQPMHGRPE